jgi:GT2 family glycosyltransferase
MSKCSIIIPVYNNFNLTKNCLDALFLHTEAASPTYEVIVVDDASTDETSRGLERYGDKIRIVTHQTNAGFAQACNDGAAASRGEYLVFINNDTVPMAGWLNGLTAYADQFPQAAIVGAKLLYPDKTVQHCGVTFNSDGNPFHLYAGFPHDHPAVNKSKEFQAVTAACMLIKSCVFKELGGFDLAYLNGYEDVDLCLRARKKGFEVHYCHESVLYHLESSTRDPKSPVEGKNLELLRSTWKDSIVQDNFIFYARDNALKLTWDKNYYLGVFLHFPPMDWMGEEGPLKNASSDNQPATFSQRLGRMKYRIDMLYYRTKVRLAIYLIKSLLRFF